MMQTGDVMVLSESNNEKCPAQPPLNGKGYPTYLPQGCYYKLWSVFHTGVETICRKELNLIRKDIIFCYIKGKEQLFWAGMLKMHIL